MPPTTFVLVPGAGGDAWYWHRLVSELETRGHEAIPVELPTGDDSAGLEEYANAIRARVGDRRGVTLVAQSMAGFSAPLVCHDGSVDHLVLVNAMIPLPNETAGAWWDNTGQSSAQIEYAASQGRENTDDLLDLFFHDVPEEVRSEAIRQGEPVQSDTPFGDPWPLAAWPDVPTRVLAARDDRLFPADFQRRVAAERLGIEAEVIPGGHLVALSYPTDLAETLMRSAQR